MALTAGCASAPASSPPAQLQQQQQQQQLQPLTYSRNSYVIASSEMPRDRMLSEIVTERWPRMVRGELPRGEIDRFATLDRFGVYDSRGSFLGGPGYLESVRVSDVEEIRRLTMVEEASKFGKGHPAGAVLITWKAPGLR